MSAVQPAYEWAVLDRQFRWNESQFHVVAQLAERRQVFATVESGVDPHNAAGGLGLIPILGRQPRAALLQRGHLGLPVLDLRLVAVGALERLRPGAPDPAQL